MTETLHTTIPGSPRRALLVLGMHRSGTSVTTRLLNLLGATLPQNLLPNARDNERGHWESLDVVTLNDRILQQVGSSWHDVTALPPHWHNMPALAAERAAIGALIERDFATAPLFVLKDPRLCRLLPLWLGVLQQQNIQPACIITYRHPEEVAASLQHRDGIAPGEAMLLWLRHIMEAERHSRHLPRAFLPYAQLLADWRHCASALAQQLNLTWPTPPQQAAPAIERFLSPQLHHHRRASTPAPDAPANPAQQLWFEPVWLALEAAARAPQPHGAALSALLDSIALPLAAADATLGATLAALHTRHHDTTQRLQAAQSHISSLEQTVQHTCATVTDERAAWSAKYDQLQSAHEELQAKSQRSEQDLAHKQQELTQLRAQLSLIQQEKQIAQAEIDWMRHTRAWAARNRYVAVRRHWHSFWNKS